MHEQTYVNAIIKNIKTLEDVKEITIEVGELAGIEAAHLKEHLKNRSNWKINSIKKDAKVKCECGFTGRPKIVERLHDFVVFECPECGETPQIIDGKTIKITKVTYI